MSQENVEIVRSDFAVARVTATGLDELGRVWAEQLRNWEAWRTPEIQERRDLIVWLLATDRPEVALKALGLSE